MQWAAAYAAAATHNRILVGGISGGGSVGSAGGWPSGGGHSFLAPNYGLGDYERRSCLLITHIANRG